MIKEADDLHREVSQFRICSRASVQDTPGLPASAARARRSISRIHSIPLRADVPGAIAQCRTAGVRIIRNAMRYLLAVHVPIIGVSFLPLLLGWPVLLYPVHIVFLEFVIDPAGSLVFEAEPSDDAVNDRRHRRSA